MDEFVKIIAPTAEDVPYASEGLWAVPRDLAAGLYQVQSVALLTEGLSAGDVVRCAPNGENRLVAVEVVERSCGVTLALVPVGVGADEDGEASRQRLVDHLTTRFGDRMLVEGGMGMLAIQFDQGSEADIVGAIATDGSGDGTVDEEAQRLGDWHFFTVSHPDWPTPQPLAGAEELLAASVEVVGVDWPHGDDELVASWPTELVEHLRDVAASDGRLRDALDERRYLAAVVPSLRRGLATEVGMDRVGPQPFPLFPATGDTAEVTEADEVFVLEWTAARDEGGAIRWCEDAETDRRFRQELTQLGLDPDADPRAPVDP